MADSIITNQRRRRLIEQSEQLLQSLTRYVCMYVQYASDVNFVFAIRIIIYKQRVHTVVV